MKKGPPKKNKKKAREVFCNLGTSLSHIFWLMWKILTGNFRSCNVQTLMLDSYSQYVYRLKYVFSTSREMIDTFLDLAENVTGRGVLGHLFLANSFHLCTMIASVELSPLYDLWWHWCSLRSEWRWKGHLNWKLEWLLSYWINTYFLWLIIAWIRWSHYAFDDFGVY